MPIFISHSSKDAGVAEDICRFLEKKGKKCFLAPRDIRSGREYAEEIINGIDHAEAMILIMSENANSSPHVLREVERAVSKAVPILVYKLTEVELSKSLEYFVMTHQWSGAKPGGDFSEIWDFVCDIDRQNSVSATESADRKTDTQTDTQEADCRKKHHKWTWAVMAGCILLLVAGVISALSYRGSRKEDYVCPYEVGDIVTFGSYNGEAIEWRVLKLSEDGAEAVLVAKQILSMKAFDAAESGTYNRDGDADYWSEDSPADTDLEIQIRVRGNNDWSVSNIRTWLNSEAEVVEYDDQAPMATAMAEKKNGYQNEPGFLHDFTKEELAAITLTEVVTAGNALAGGEEVTMDRVFLLSLEELGWFEEAGISKLAVPTEAAIEQDQSFWYRIDAETYGIKEYGWWLREPVEGTSSKCYMVGNGYAEDNLWKENVGLEGFGIRPAITVNLQADCFTADEP